MYVVDEAGRLLPSGEEGEIVVRSAYLPAGYWRDAERTARTCEPVPDTPNERLCRTGDLGRLRPDGCLEHLGRKDRRVKVRGFRVELDEVEELLASHPSVLRAAVLVRTDRRGDSLLVAYLELKAGANTPVEEVRRYASLRLPDYMVPATYVVLDAMPVSDTGKINRSRLPELPLDRPLLSTAASRHAPHSRALSPRSGVTSSVSGASASHDPFSWSAATPCVPHRSVTHVRRRWRRGADREIAGWVDYRRARRVCFAEERSGRELMNVLLFGATGRATSFLFP